MLGTFGYIQTTADQQVRVYTTFWTVKPLTTEPQNITNRTCTGINKNLTNSMRSLSIFFVVSTLTGCSFLKNNRIKFLFSLNSTKILKNIKLTYRYIAEKMFGIRWDWNQWPPDCNIPVNTNAFNLSTVVISAT